MMIKTNKTDSKNKTKPFNLILLVIVAHIVYAGAVSFFIAIFYLGFLSVFDYYHIGMDRALTYGAIMFYFPTLIIVLTQNEEIFKKTARIITLIFAINMIILGNGVLRVIGEILSSIDIVNIYIMGFAIIGLISYISSVSKMKEKDIKFNLPYVFFCVGIFIIYFVKVIFPIGSDLLS